VKEGRRHSRPASRRKRHPSAGIFAEEGQEVGMSNVSTLWNCHCYRRLVELAGLSLCIEA